MKSNKVRARETEYKIIKQKSLIIYFFACLRGKPNVVYYWAKFPCSSIFGEVLEFALITFYFVIYSCAHFSQQEEYFFKKPNKFRKIQAIQHSRFCGRC